MDSPFFPNPLSHAVFSAAKMGKATLVRGTQMMVGLNAFEPGQRHDSHVHEGADKIYFVLEGRGEFHVGDERRVLGAGSLIVAPAGVSHGVTNSSSDRLVVMMAMAPPPG